MSGTELANGILPIQQLEDAIETGVISAATGIEASQLQPASLDLRLGDEAWRVQASFLPGRNMSVADKLEKFAMHRIDLRNGAVLECGCVYIVKLQESLRLPEAISAMANPKSSTGRLDIFTRLITDNAVEFEADDAERHFQLQHHHSNTHTCAHAVTRTQTHAHQHEHPHANSNTTTTSSFAPTPAPPP